MPLPLTEESSMFFMNLFTTCNLCLQLVMTSTSTSSRSVFSNTFANQSPSNVSCLTRSGSLSALMSLKHPTGVKSFMPLARWTVTLKYSFSASCGGVVVLIPPPEGVRVGECNGESLTSTRGAAAVLLKFENAAIAPNEWGSMTMFKNWNCVASVSNLYGLPPSFHTILT